MDRRICMGFRVFDSRVLKELEGTLMMSQLVCFSLYLPRFPRFLFSSLWYEQQVCLAPTVCPGGLSLLLPLSLPILTTPTSKACTYSFLLYEFLLLWFFQLWLTIFSTSVCICLSLRQTSCCLTPEHFVCIHNISPTRFGMSCGQGQFLSPVTQSSVHSGHLRNWSLKLQNATHFEWGFSLWFSFTKCMCFLKWKGLSSNNRSQFQRISYYFY